MRIAGIVVFGILAAALLGCAAWGTLNGEPILSTAALSMFLNCMFMLGFFTGVFEISAKYRKK